MAKTKHLESVHIASPNTTPTPYNVTPYLNFQESKTSAPSSSTFHAAKVYKSLQEDSSVKLSKPELQNNTFLSNLSYKTSLQMPNTKVDKMYRSAFKRNDIFGKTCIIEKQKGKRQVNVVNVDEDAALIDDVPNIFTMKAQRSSK